jgi:ssDNA-binding Zn-finger/Zn-ribbon topoisomerase 1
MEQNNVQKCQTCGKDFLLIKMETDFYQRQGYPLPKECPNCRQLRREAQRPPRTFIRRKCDKCGKDMITVFPKGEIQNCLLPGVFQKLFQ